MPNHFSALPNNTVPKDLDEQNNDYRLSLLSRRQFLAITGGLGLLSALSMVGASGFRWLLGHDSRRDLRMHAGLSLYTKVSHALGNKVSIIIAHESRDEAEKILSRAFREISRLEDIFSLYRPGSLINRLNRNGRIDSPAPELVFVLKRAMDFSEATDGALDVTVQPLWNLYSRSFHNWHSAPKNTEIIDVMTHVGYKAVQVSNDSIRFDRPQMAITLNGIAQGYITDQVLEFLKSQGVEHALVDAGEVGALGSRPDGSQWRIAIRGPKMGQKHLPMIRMEDPRHKKLRVATSGGYGTQFSKDGSDHHIFDPRTGLSAGGIASVTVFAHTCTDADALSTALAVVGPTEAKPLLRRFSAAAVTMDSAGEWISL